MKRRGMTLVEMLVVVLIISALAAIAIPRISQGSQNAKSQVCQTNLDTMDTQSEIYNTKNGVYATILTELTNNSDIFPDGQPVCPLGGTYWLSLQSRSVCTHNPVEAGNNKEKSNNKNKDKDLPGKGNLQ